MKKWTVLVVIALLGLILGLQYLNKKNEAKQAGQSASALGGQPSESAGVGLPPEAAGYARNYPQVSPDPGASAAPGAFAFPAIKGAEASKGACDGGSLNDIMASHGRTWGYSAQGTVFSSFETMNMYEALVNYSSCKAVATDDMAACDYLPASSYPGSKGDVRYENPRNKCVDGANRVLFSAYMAGKYSNISACVTFLSGRALHDINLDPSEFCPMAAKGMENVCAGLVPHIPASEMSECPAVFPGKKTDCREGRDRHKVEICLANYELYSAIKTGNPGQCPAGNRASCEAFFSKSQAPCSSPAMQASKLYCSYLAKLKKRVASGFRPPEEQKEAENMNRNIRATLKGKQPQ